MKVSENCFGCLKTPMTPPLLQQYHGVNINGAIFKILFASVRAMMGEYTKYNIDIYITNIFEVDLIYVLSVRILLRFYIRKVCEQIGQMFSQ